MTRLPAERRRREILTVATELFRRRHYGEVSLDEVADTAGVTRGLINHHFGTKRDLYIAVIELIVDVELFPVPEYIHDTTLRDRLEVSVGGWLDVIERSRDLWLDSVRAQGMGDVEVIAVIERAREKGAHRLAAVMGIGLAGTLTEEQVATFRVLEGLAEAAVLQWLEYDRLTRPQAEAIILEAFETAGERLLAASPA